MGVDPQAVATSARRRPGAMTDADFMGSVLGGREIGLLRAGRPI
jgi:hypothetical protein